MSHITTWLSLLMRREGGERGRGRERREGEGGERKGEGEKEGERERGEREGRKEEEGTEGQVLLIQIL